MLKNVKIQTKLMVSFLIVTFIAICLVVYGTFQIKQLDISDSNLNKQIVVALGDIAKTSTDMLKLKLAYRDEMDEMDPGKANSYYKDLEDIHTDIESNMFEYEKTITTPKGRGLYNKFLSNYSEYQKNESKLLNLIRMDPVGALMFCFNTMDKKSMETQNAILALLSVLAFS